MNYYSFHIGDFVAATVHLSPMEELAYRRMLDLYYDTEQPIPLETQWVSRRLRMDTQIVDSVLSEFFVKTENGWINPRCDAEIATYRRKVDANRLNGKQGGRPKKTHSVILANPSESQNNLNQEPITNNQEPINPPNPPGADRAVETVEDPLFAEFWNAYPKKVGKESARKAWSKIKAPKATIALVIDALAWQVTSQQWTKNGGQFVPNPTTYLNQHRWLDERGADTTVGGMTPAGHAAANAASRWLESQEFPTERKTA